ncbi:ATP-dependent helicase [Ovoidimarina sediminis]|uniref:ATP-dependent helicase n=1 Tax=Ovoidimarina sediminis TaxID=3079856 RepID=UPI00290A8965|nr:ATP-dependent helicase [Rhodophyticola sp. MJ-SS7]MDU8945924.1 ATP-dependent helicase [Rhodophyticola sp. MJ-SS7]
MAWNDGLIPGSPAYQIASETNTRVRVVAGPGTGKSFAMKRRVGRLLEEGVDPAQILPVTFTRVAAEDLHRELVGMAVPGCDELEGTTLHRLCLRRLSRNAVLAATGRNARPLNQFELEPMIADLMRDGRGKRAIRKLQAAYEAAWARLQHEDPGHAVAADDAEFQAELLAWMRFHEAMLIGEVVPLFYNFLSANPAAAERSEFSHILVDEYQDLNKAEQGVVRLMSDAADVCIVGDDDQSIYSFKHAHPDGIRDWMADNAHAADIGLDECRRCPTRVVEMAGSLIANNVNRPVPRPLNLIPANGVGDVSIIQYGTLNGEVAGVTQLVSQFVADGVPPGDILVLAQSKAVGTPIFEAIAEAGVAVRSEYTESELSSLNAQRAFALLKLLDNRDDRVALRWLVGVDSNTWNSAGYRRVRDRCEASGDAPWAVLEQLRDGVLTLPYTGNIVQAFCEICADLDALDAVPDLAGLVDQLFPDGQPETREIRSLSLQVLDDNPDCNRTEFVAELLTAVTQPEIPNNVDYVRIMSLHKSKGLSAPVTIVSGCVERLLPRRPDQDMTAQQAADQLEEQRRLFYVGITRVKAAPDEGKPGTLVLTYAQEMPFADAMQAGIQPAQQAYGTAVLIASRFINELGAAAPNPIAG